MPVETLDVASNVKNYQVRLEPDFSFVQELAGLDPAVFVIDQRVWELYSAGPLAALPKERVITLPALEERKTLECAAALYEKLMAFSARKNLNLVSIGGGIIQDVTGFVAATLYRGVRWHYAPTTLLAQCDSCIGAKTSLNFGVYKNLLGVFYPPLKIHLCAGFTRTLAEGDFYSGLGEMAKLFLMDGEASARAFSAAAPLLAERDEKTLLPMIRQCLEIKKAYIENDEFDSGRRNLLNYGHCFGHALESATGFAVPHGQAVVLGMLLANAEARARGLLNAQTEEWVRKQVLLPVLKTDVSALTFDPQAVVRAMGQDKKNVGTGLALVMLTDGYQLVKITDYTQEAALKRLEQLGELAHD